MADDRGGCLPNLDHDRGDRPSTREDRQFDSYDSAAIASPKSASYFPNRDRERTPPVVRIDLHPEAARALDARGESLLAAVGELSAEPKRPRFESQRFPPLVISQDHIVGRIRGERIDDLKNEVTAVEFECNEGVVGLEGDAVKELAKLTHMAHKYIADTANVSELFLRRQLIEWIERRHRREIAEPLSTFLPAQVTAAVVPRTVLIPIANLCLEADLPFGLVEFKVITAALMDDWHGVFKAGPLGEHADFEGWFERLRKTTQGLAAVSMTVESDEYYALQECLEKAEQAVALLRIIHPVNTSPNTILYVRPLGSESLESYSAYCYEGDAFRGHRIDTRWPFPTFFEFPRSEHQTHLLRNLIALFSARERTDYQQRLFDALLIYSRNNISKEPSEKLVFCLVAVESMLLRNASEPVQDNIGERMAYLVGDSPADRMEIERLVKRVYELRSQFVHHGQRPKDMDTLARFMEKVWVLFIHLIFNLTAVSTKDEMLDALKRMKYR